MVYKQLSLQLFRNGFILQIFIFALSYFTLPNPLSRFNSQHIRKLQTEREKERMNWSRAKGRGIYLLIAKKPPRRSSDSVCTNNLIQLFRSDKSSYTLLFHLLIRPHFFSYSVMLDDDFDLKIRILCCSNFVWNLGDERERSMELRMKQMDLWMCVDMDQFMCSRLNCEVRGRECMETVKWVCSMFEGCWCVFCTFNWIHGHGLCVSVWSLGLRPKHSFSHLLQLCIPLPHFNLIPFYYSFFFNYSFNWFVHNFKLWFMIVWIEIILSELG